MKAIVCRELGALENLVLDEVPSPVAGPGQAVVSVKAAGVNFPDILVVQGKYQFRHALPFSPGGEIAGIVKEVGEGVTRLKVGDPVLAVAMHGGFAEEALLDASALIPLAPGIDFAVAAAVMFAQARRSTRSRIARASAWVKRYWCWVPRAVSGWRQWKSASRWAPP